MVGGGWGAGLLLLAAFVAAASLEAPAARAVGPAGGAGGSVNLLEQLDGTVLLAEEIGVREHMEFVSELDTKKTQQESKRKTDESVTTATSRWTLPRPECPTLQP